MSVAEEIENIARPILSEAGIEIVQVEYQREPQGWVLRFYLDKEGGVSLADCQEWSRRLEEIVDVSGRIPQAYVLEVSSPGLNRPLRKVEDFKRFLGLEAVIRLYAPQNGQKNFHGKMLSLENEGRDLMILDRTSGLVKLPLVSIAGAKLDTQI